MHTILNQRLRAPADHPTVSTASAPHRSIRSYVLRTGRITAAQQRALDELAPRYELPFGTMPLDWQQIYSRTAPRSLEIGFGNGENLAALAAARPERDYLGLEVHRPGMGHLLLLAEKHLLTNVRAICHDAVEVVQQQIDTASLDEILILFPDPWHKKRHHKRRLIQPEFVALAASRLRAGGVLRLATDWEHYAQQMLEVLRAEARLRNLSPSNDFMPRDALRVPTRFEKRGQRLGHGVRDLAFEVPAQ